MSANLDDLLSCSICLETLTRPKALPCQHTFCHEPCMKNIIVGNRACCPICRREHVVPSEGFATNFLIEQLLDLKNAGGPTATTRTPTAPSENLLDDQHDKNSDYEDEELSEAIRRSLLVNHPVKADHNSDGGQEEFRAAVERYVEQQTKAALLKAQSHTHRAQSQADAAERQAEALTEAAELRAEAKMKAAQAQAYSALQRAQEQIKAAERLTLEAERLTNEHAEGTGSQDDLQEALRRSLSSNFNVHNNNRNHVNVTINGRTISLENNNDSFTLTVDDIREATQDTKPTKKNLVHEKVNQFSANQGSSVRKFSNPVISVVTQTSTAPKAARAYYATCDYTAKTRTEVSFLKDDIIFEMETINNSNWIKGRIMRNGEIGFVPLFKLNLSGQSKPN